MESVSTLFHWADYLVLTLVLIASCSVGVYYGFFKRSTTTEDYLMADRSMPVIPVAVSLYVSWVSAISFLGDPVEVYMKGSIQMAILIGYVLGLLVGALFFAPRFHRLRLTSVFEYLEVRLGKVARTIGVLGQLIYLIVYLGVALYAPAIVISQVTGISVHVTVIIVGSISTFYTTLGGVKAVVWVDTAQVSVMLAGVLALLIQGTKNVGGLNVVIQAATESGRLQPWSFELNFMTSNFWAYMFGSFFIMICTLASSQYIVQRYCIVKTTRQASLVIYLCIPIFIVVGLLFGFTGLMFTAYFKDCDPLKSGRIEKPDQMIPLMVMELFHSLPGIPGLIISSVATAALSSLSSGQNAIAVNLLKDVIEPIYKRHTRLCLTDKVSLILAKSLSVLSGVILILVAFLVLGLKGNLFAVTYQLIGCVSGPSSALFLFAMFFTKVHDHDIVIGFMAGLALPFWFVVESLTTDYVAPTLPMSISGCNITTYDVTMMNTTVHPSSAQYLMTNTSTFNLHLQQEKFSIDKMSYMWYIPIGYMTTVFGVMASYLVTVLLKRLIGKENSKYDMATLDDSVDGMKRDKHEDDCL